MEYSSELAVVIYFQISIFEPLKTTYNAYFSTLIML